MSAATLKPADSVLDNAEKPAAPMAAAAPVAVRPWYNRYLPFPHFPAFSGPHAVGMFDFEWEDAFTSPDGVAHLAEHRVSEAESVLVRVFYPTTHAAANSGAHHRPLWLSEGEGIGYGDFLRIPRFVSWPLFGSVFSLTRLPAYQLAPLAPPEANALPKHLPVIVFSHGLGGCKGTYSYFCGDMASRGCVVFAVEHRDRSAALSRERNGQVHHTYQRAPTDSDWDFRARQIRHRVAEVRATLALADRFHRGNPPPNHLFPKNHIAAQFKDRLDLAKAAIAGHSFGGATALGVLQAQREHTAQGSHVDGERASDPAWPHRFVCGFAMDPWMYPLDASRGVDVPVLMASTETFHWHTNAHAMSTMLRASAGHAHEILTTRGTAHQNHSDFPLLLAPLMRKMNMAGPMHPLRALHLNNAAAASFMARHGVALPNPHYYLDKDEPRIALQHTQYMDGPRYAPTPASGDTPFDPFTNSHPLLIHGFQWYADKFGVAMP